MIHTLSYTQRWLVVHTHVCMYVCMDLRLLRAHMRAFLPTRGAGGGRGGLTPFRTCELCVGRRKR